ncbi:beta-galactosidase/beta-glucuronidase [Marmoricola sp. OAE513]|uniref:glycoside hydrolase family 2 protein n=1 Tax=Marmoricola sp. OAE513 TaxID=2817894 RepID=UPI001AE11161
MTVEPSLTRWGRDLDVDHPLPEHPRPQLARGGDSWINLNGRWEYAFGGPEHPTTWDGEIVVPFSPETELSGVGRQLQPEEFLWYRLRISTSSLTGLAATTGSAGARMLLHFGAVDQVCTVWVNDVEVGSHTGGYLPFSFDVTDALVAEDQTIVVRVRDLSEAGPHARGKQRLDAGRIWYTAQSGIWQTVWLEAVPETYVERLTIVPDLTGLAVTVTTSRQARGPDQTPGATVRVLDGGTLVAEVTGPANTPLRLDVPDPHLWSPADPHLYDLEITCGADLVTSYAALRTFGTGPDADGHQRFLLNGEPIQHVGVLDQGYWPDGLMTAPSDAAIVHDLETVKALGFTVVRKHVKVEPLRWYHHCDRLGLLVWQDVVNGGGRYRELVANLPARWPIRLSDSRYDFFFRSDAAARAEFREEVRATVALLRNTASVAVWVPFNEGWGQFDAAEIAAEVKELDPSRSVCHASGWIDQGGGDVKSYHRYLRPFRFRPRRRERRTHALSEYGGLGLGGESDEVFDYGHCEDADALATAFTRLHTRWITPAVRRGLAATIYTQLTDVETERNGLMTWDRETLKIDAEVVRSVTRAIS